MIRGHPADDLSVALLRSGDQASRRNRLRGVVTLGRQEDTLLGFVWRWRPIEG